MPDERPGQDPEQTTRGVRERLLDRLLDLAGALVEQVRRHLPAALLPALVALRSRLAWAVPSVRADAEQQMEFLLGVARPGTERAPVARRYVHEMVRRAETRWQPEVATAIRLEGAEHLRAAADRGRGVVLSFMHHGLYDRGFPAVARVGVPMHVMVHPYMLRDDAPRWLRQHVRLNQLGGARPLSSDVGAEGMVRLLGEGNVLGIATDVPGRTPLRFAGRDVLGSFGAARLAVAAGAPVVLMTSERDADGEHLRLHPALLPEDHDGPQALLAAMLARHEEAVLAWPEATDLPRSRWGTPAPAEVTAAR